MLARCYNSHNPNYRYYGARGIGICNEWIGDFSTFRDWSLSHGYRDDLTLDRIDVNGNYTPDNCRWTTAKVQANNTRANHNITIDGVTKTLKEWSEIYGINDKTVRDRLVRGWDPIRAVVTPSDPKYRKKVI